MFYRFSKVTAFINSKSSHERMKSLIHLLTNITNKTLDLAWICKININSIVVHVYDACTNMSVSYIDCQWWIWPEHSMVRCRDVLMFKMFTHQSRI